MLAHQLLAARAAGDVSAGWVDAIIVAEAAGIAMDVNQVVKFAVARQRPFVHYGASGDPGRKPDPDDNVSFYSGHTTFTFAVAAAAGTVSSMRGYESAPWVWGVGMTLAATTGYLRIAGDKHYLTDVLVGAGTGIAAGIALPRLLHPKERAATPGAETAGMAFTPYPLGVSGVF
jgi:membrane-associated phospholipid phosphatase